MSPLRSLTVRLSSAAQSFDRLTGVDVVLPRERYLMARHEARYHVTVEVQSAALAGRTPGPMQVVGRVVEVFRTDGKLQVGDGVSFVEWVTRPNEEIPCGGTKWKYHDAVLAARFIEAFLDGEPPDCEVALWQSEVVSSPTGTPRMRGWFPLTALGKRGRRARADREATGSWWRRLFG